jgi:hypothetical protein
MVVLEQTFNRLNQDPRKISLGVRFASNAIGMQTSWKVCNVPMADIAGPPALRIVTKTLHCLFIPLNAGAGPVRDDQRAVARPRGDSAMARTYRDIAMEEMLGTVEEAMSQVIDCWGDLPPPMKEAIEHGLHLPSALSGD